MLRVAAWCAFGQLAVLCACCHAACWPWLYPAPTPLPSAPSATQPPYICRDSVLLCLHVVMYAFQYWAVRAQGTNWLASNAVLATHPLGLWLLVCVFTMQVRTGGWVIG